MFCSLCKALGTFSSQTGTFYITVKLHNHTHKNCPFPKSHRAGEGKTKKRRRKEEEEACTAAMTPATSSTVNQHATHKGRGKGREGVDMRDKWGGHAEVGCHLGQQVGWFSCNVSQNQRGFPVQIGVLQKERGRERETKTEN